MEDVLEILKKYKKILLLVLAFLVLTIVCMKVSGSQKRALADVNNSVAQVKSQIALLQTKASDSSTYTDSVNVGLDAERVTSDESVIQDFLQTIFAFDDVDAYEEIRDSLVADYGLSSSSQFLRYFYPAIGSANQTGSGLYYPKEDGNYQVAFQDVTSYVVYINNGAYTYVNYVQLESDGQEYDVCIVCTVATGNEITDVTGYVLQTVQEEE